MKFFIFLLLVSTFSISNASKILCIFPGIAHSHYTLGYALSKGLATKGHEVTFVSPFEPKEEVKNLKHVVLKGLAQQSADIVKNWNFFDMAGWSPFLTVLQMGLMGLQLSESTIKHEAIQNLLKSEEKFDLVIIENFLSDSLQAIAYHYKVPSVLASTLAPNVWINHISGIPDMPSFMPNIFLSVESEKMDFSERVYNTLLTLFQKTFDHVYYYPKQNQLVKKYFPESPNIYDLIYNTSLVFTNSHVSFNKPDLLASNVVEIGGYHVDPPKKLPRDLQEILDNSKEGVVYFSLGSNLKSAQLYPELREAVMNALKRLKCKVLWKFEDDALPGKPDNVIIRKWFPQNDVLAHPNVKLFITHGGLLSTTETIYHGVPIVTIPVFGDQANNAALAVKAGYAQTVPFKKLSEQTLYEAINEVLTNPKYSENAKSRSKLFHDRDIAPIDKAAYWVEYVIRHKGAHHLKSSALKFKSYEYYMVDVIIFLTVVTIVLFATFYMIIRWILGRKHPPKVAKNAKVKKQ